MRVIGGVEMVSSGNGGGGASHNGKPGRRNDKVLNGESRRVEVRGELEGEQGGTCHNDKPGQMMEGEKQVREEGSKGGKGVGGY